MWRWRRRWCGRDLTGFQLATHNLCESLIQVFSSRRAGVDGLGGRVSARFKQGASISHQLQAMAMDSNVNLNDVGFLTRNDFIDVRYTLGYWASAPVERYLYPLVGRKKPYARLVIEKPGVNFNMFHRQKASTGDTIGQGVTLSGHLTGPKGEFFHATLGYFPKRTDDLLLLNINDSQVPNRLWAELSMQGVQIADTVANFNLLLGQAQEETGHWGRYLRTGIRYNPSDDLSVQAGIEATRRQKALLAARGSSSANSSFTTLHPSLSLHWRPAPNQTIAYD